MKVVLYLFIIAAWATLVMHLMDENQKLKETIKFQNELARMYVGKR